jgi:hypothetical protein
MPLGNVDGNIAALPHLRALWLDDASGSGLTKGRMTAAAWETCGGLKKGLIDKDAGLVILYKTAANCIK